MVKVSARTIVVCQFCRRSGGHAVMNWILNGFDNSQFVNCITPKIKNKVPVRFNHVDWQAQNMVLGMEDRLSYDKSIEDIVHGIHTYPMYPLKQKDVQFYFSIIRDPYNHFASRMKAGEGRQKPPLHSFLPGCVDWYIKLIEQTEKSHHFSFINFNEWVSSVGYRRTLALDKLRMAKKNYIAMDTHLEQISKLVCAGSSFTGFRQQIITTEDVNRRFTHYIDDPRYQTEVVKNKKLREISEEHFPDMLVQLKLELKKRKLSRLW